MIVVIKQIDIRNVNCYEASQSDNQRNKMKYNFNAISIPIVFGCISMSSPTYFNMYRDFSNSLEYVLCNLDDVSAYQAFKLLWKRNTMFVNYLNDFVKQKKNSRSFHRCIAKNKVFHSNQICSWWFPVDSWRGSVRRRAAISARDGDLYGGNSITNLNVSCLRHFGKDG